MDGGARLSSLRRAAEAMDCTLVYAFIPNSTLQQTVERQAGTILEKQMKRQTVFLLPRQQIHSEIVACHLWIRLVDSKSACQRRKMVLVCARSGAPADAPSFTWLLPA